MYDECNKMLTSSKLLYKRAKFNSIVELSKNIHLELRKMYSILSYRIKENEQNDEYMYQRYRSHVMSIEYLKGLLSKNILLNYLQSYKKYQLDSF